MSKNRKKHKLTIRANKGDEARHIANLLKRYEKRIRPTKEIVEDGNV